VSHLERAAARRSHPGVLGNLAQAYFALGRYADARETFRKAGRLDPGAAQFQLGIANSLAMEGRLGEAETLLRRLTSRFPRNALAWFNLGNVLRDLGRPADAQPCFLEALAIDPAHLDARNNLGGVLQKLYRFDEAEREYRACIARAPGYPLAKCNLGSVLIDVGRLGEAEAVLREAVATAPGLGEARAYLGAALGRQGRLREALAHHREAAMLSPTSSKSVECYMAALLETGHVAEGFRWLARARHLNPNSIPAHQLAASALLALGYFGEGWEEYAYRPAYFAFRERYPDGAITRELPLDIAGRHIWLLQEQGLGDEIFFLRFAAQLKAAGARTGYVASTKIVSLLRRVGFLDEVVEELAPQQRADMVMLVGDLPYALARYPGAALPPRTPSEDPGIAPAIAQRISVFWPPIAPAFAIPPLEARIEQMRERLAQAGSPPYVGLTWKGGTAPERQTSGDAWLLYKQIGLEPLGGALRGISGTLVALQRKPADGEIETLSGHIGRTVHDFSDLNNDLEGMLALLALIDDYVGVSNTNMHLRAAAGRTARVLVPEPAEWRWMAARASSPWFPGFSIYRQSLDGSWAQALAKLREDLGARRERAADLS
jgi:tetratricopeptide (TPR) repeat protein